MPDLEPQLRHEQPPRDIPTPNDLRLIRELAESGLGLRELAEVLKAMHRTFDGTDVH